MTGGMSTSAPAVLRLGCACLLPGASDAHPSPPPGFHPKLPANQTPTMCRPREDVEAAARAAAQQDAALARALERSWRVGGMLLKAEDEELQRIGALGQAAELIARLCPLLACAANKQHRGRCGSRACYSYHLCTVLTVKVEPAGGAALRSDNHTCHCGSPACSESCCDLLKPGLCPAPLPNACPACQLAEELMSASWRSAAAAAVR